jgi:plastocyanin domain-containing protein
VLILGAYNISNGTTLLSLSIPSTTVISPVDDTTREVQEVRMTQDDNGYSPSTLSIDAGKKIRWIITGKSPYACSTQIVVPQLHISKSIQAGENVIEFIAPESGEIPFSCSMGMYRGKFTIVNKNVSNTPQEIPSVSTSSNGSTCGMMTKKA